MSSNLVSPFQTQSQTAPPFKRPTRFAHFPLPSLIPCSSHQIAVHNDIDYATVLAQVTEARQKGLTVPVLLMGLSPPSIPKKRHISHHCDLQAITIPCSLTEKKRPSRMPETLVQMAS